MKKILFLTALCFTLATYAEFIRNPDANTLWIEDGKNISGWSEGLTFVSLPDGGFSVADGTKNDSGRYVPVDTVNYPWMVCEVTGVSHTGSYRNFSFHGYFGMTSQIFKGIYVFKYGQPGKDKEHLRFNLYGTKMDIKYIKVVKKPADYIETVSKGGKLKVMVHLAKPAEDVSIRFFKSYTMPQVKLGGQGKLQLKPADEKNAVEWSGEIALPADQKLDGILAQATVLGGEVTVPIWGKL